MLRVPRARLYLLESWRSVVLLGALVIIRRAIIVCQQALAHMGKMLNGLGVCAVDTTKIMQEALIPLTRFFWKQLIKVCHDTVPFYCCS
jgi:hypothetical protein